MQNRTNRNLLFGSRASTGNDPTSVADAETVETENQNALSNLRGSAGTMKDIALTIDGSVNEQNRSLDRMDKRFDSANSLITNTMNALNEMTGDRTSSRMCVMIGVLFVALVILYQFFKKH